MIVKDAVRKRRAYLANKAGANLTSVVGSLMAIVDFGILAVLIGCCFAGGSIAPSALGCLFVVGPCSVINLVVWLSRLPARHIPYVPPVREQIAVLSAEEVLLRGSDAPIAAPSGTLLRAAHSAVVEPAEELLRAVEV